MPALQGGRRTLCEAAVDLLHPRAVSALQPVAVTIRELSEPPPFAHRGRPVSDPLLQTDLPVPDNHIGILFFDFVGDGDSNGERETTGEGGRGGRRILTEDVRASSVTFVVIFFPGSSRQ